jgi:UDP-N-acetylglucosamine 2-epimerase (non-hydrolysing)
MHKIVLVFGTRPEMIKLAPVIRAFRKRGQRDRLFIVHTGQHSELLRVDLEHFGIAVDYTFALERENDSLALLNGLLLLEFHKLRAYWNEQAIRPSALLAIGDTASAFAAAQFAFYEKIPFMHIEAGLRRSRRCIFRPPPRRRRTCWPNRFPRKRSASPGIR